MMITCLLCHPVCTLSIKFYNCETMRDFESCNISRNSRKARSPPYDTNSFYLKLSPQQGTLLPYHLLLSATGSSQLYSRYLASHYLSFVRDVPGRKYPIPVRFLILTNVFQYDNALLIWRKYVRIFHSYSITKSRIYTKYSSF